MGYSEKYKFHFTDKADYDKKLQQIPEVREKKRESASQWYNDNKERASERDSEYYHKPENKKRKIEKSQEWYMNNKINKNERDKEKWGKGEKPAKNSWLLRTYGISEDQRVQMILEQDNKCARCYLPFDLDGSGNTSNAPVVDHDHSYPKGDPDSIRSIIHQKCNIMIGMHSDSIEELEKSIKYLKKYSKVV